MKLKIMNATENNDYYQLLAYSYFSNTITEKEKAELLAWIEQSGENRRFFLEIQAITSASAPADYSKTRFSSQKAMAWDRLDAKIKDQNIAQFSISKTTIWNVFRIAASLLLLVSTVTFATLYIKDHKAKKNFYAMEHEILVPMGGKSQIVLPDGTKVWLNAGSKLKYSGNYGLDSRNVYLEGEGYFSVIKNPKKPFVVHSSNILIKAYGTKFNVKAYPEEKIVTTTLVEGVVKIEGRDLHVSMTPREVITIRKDAVAISKPVKTAESPKNTTSTTSEEKEVTVDKVNDQYQCRTNVNTDSYTSWKDNMWIIDSQSLQDIAILLERRFNVAIHIQSKDLESYKFTGTFNKETLEQILHVIKLTAPIRYEINKGVIDIWEESKRKETYKSIVN